MTSDPTETVTVRRGPAEARGPAALVLLSEHPGIAPAFALASQSVFVGREPLAGGYRLADPSVSKAHAQVFRKEDRWFIRDLGSRNHVFVNGAQTPEQLLNPGDVLRLGNVLLTLVETNAKRYLDFDPTRRSPTRNPLGMVAGPALSELEAQVLALAPTPMSVLISGETGTGKEGIAQAIHRLSGRAGPFRAVNCAAIAEGLVESELFGHRKGAFTGATSQALGLFQAAHRGTLLLDEIGDMPLAAQAKLLRVLETGEVMPVGTSEPVAVDVRVIAATHRPLFAMHQSGTFRGDLLARLTGFSIDVPPLRARRDDLVHLLKFAVGETPLRWSTDVLHALLLYPWPLNVRELLNVVRAAAIVARGELQLEHLPESIRHFRPNTAAADEAASPVVRRERQPKPSLEQLRAALTQAGGNVAAAARELDRDRALVHRWLKEAGLDPDAFRTR